LIIDSLEKAIKERRPKAGLLFHSDQGVQYASDDMQNFLANNEIVCSMSRKGECYDNAVAESFFDSLKSEWLYQQELLTRTEAKQGLFEYIEIS
jgi:putative transposase